MCDELPRPQFLSQKEYFRTRLSFDLTASEIPQNTVCSICVEECNHTNNTDAIVRILARQSCYFHNEFIKAWFTSTDQKRGTCPNDRRELFNPSPIDVARFNNLAASASSQSTTVRHSLYYSLVYDLIDSTMDDAVRFGEAWNQCARGTAGDDRYHEDVISFFASAQSPYVLQANLQKLRMALQDTNLPEDMLGLLRQSVRWTGYAFDRPRDMYVRLATHDLQSTYVILTKRLSSLTLYSEAM